MARGEDWSRLEVEATVASYFEMLRLDLENADYNKSARRRELQRLLDERSEASIERKHQNISAVLLELGFPYIDGYKPLSNYQDLLRAVVEDRLEAEPGLVERVAKEVELEVVVPTVDDILATLTDPPEPRNRAPRYARERPIRPAVIRPNYLLREARNASLGHAGERFALNFERARLIAAGQERLAANVEHVAETRGDHEGFDILSFETSGVERLIEVKTTGFGRYTPFFVTPNEVATSRRVAERYHLYRVFAFRDNPGLFSVPGPLDRSFDLSPSEYIARMGS
jgi:hypothetical protein